jgi:hypothetical protein
MATLAKLLQVDMGLPDMAKRLAAAGRGKDSILAHINPKEAKLLKKHGGSGKINPETGIMEFDDGEGYFTEGSPEVDYSNDTTPSTVAQTTPVAPQAETPPAPRRQITDYQATAPAGLDMSKPNLPIPSAPAPVAATPTQAAPLAGSTITGENLGASQRDFPSAAAPAAAPAEPGLMERLTGYADQAAALNKTLSPFAPYAKFGAQALALAQGQKAADQSRQEAQTNEAEIRKLSDPYRAQAQQIAQQGQNLLAMGQKGQLTADQQQKLETQRAVAMQQQSQAGVTGGTAAQQSEAQIQRLAQEYAQQNIAQGLQLLTQAQAISGTADKLIQEAIRTGYAGSQDANKLASEFYNAIGFSLPETQSKAPTQAGATNA